ncbi:MAG: hypothetical protein SOZ27_05395 [Spirochaetia bacterium]|nr:hypothetical protein [Spirochaetia bacterium]
MKKAFFLTVLISVASVLFAQNFEDNEYYRRSVELKEKAKVELENGNYEQSIQYSVEAKEQAQLSLEYIEKMKLIYRANSKVKMAGYRIDYAKRIKLADFNAELFESASAWYNAAVEAFETEDYQTAITEADKVINALAGIRRMYKPSETAEAENVLPQYYVVKLVPECRDCLWRIAGKKEVYGDPYKWTVLYEANKDTLKSDSPHLIYPGEKLLIPSINGEKREGSF